MAVSPIDASSGIIIGIPTSFARFRNKIGLGKKRSVRVEHQGVKVFTRYLLKLFIRSAREGIVSGDQ